MQIFWVFWRMCVCSTTALLFMFENSDTVLILSRRKTPQHPYWSHENQIFTLPDLSTGQLELWHMNTWTKPSQLEICTYNLEIAHEARLQNSFSSGGSQCPVSSLFYPDSSLGMNSIFWSCSLAFLLSLSSLISFQQIPFLHVSQCQQPRTFTSLFLVQGIIVFQILRGSILHTLRNIVE